MRLGVLRGLQFRSAARAGAGATGGRARGMPALSIRGDDGEGVPKPFPFQFFFVHCFFNAAFSNHQPLSCSCARGQQHRLVYLIFKHW